MTEPAVIAPDHDGSSCPVCTTPADRSLTTAGTSVQVALLGTASPAYGPGCRMCGGTTARGR